MTLPREPLPPDILADAQTDRVHVDIGHGRAVDVVRVTLPREPEPRPRFRRLHRDHPLPSAADLLGPDHGVGLVRVEEALRRFDAAWVAAMERERRKAPAPTSVRELREV